MNTLNLEIVSPDKKLFSGEVKSVTVTTENGEIQILRGHTDLVAALKTGRAKITFHDGKERVAASSGGFILVSDGLVKLVTTTFEFADTIDIERARRAMEAAEEKLRAAKDDKTIAIAKAKLERALCRISVADGK